MRLQRMFPVALAAVLMLSGCGYALLGRSSNLPEDIQTIYVQALQNRTQRSQIDQVLTRAISDELLTRRRFNVVSDRSSADAVLSGAITGFFVRPVTFGQEGGRATEYEIIIAATMKFERTDREEVLWEQPRYQFRENYNLEESETAFFSREDLAIEEVSEKFAETLVIDLLEGF